MCSGCRWALASLPPITDFDPVAMNATAWVEAAASFGAKYLVLAANHAGGFALWPTKAVVPRHGRYNYSVAYSRGQWTDGRKDPDIVAEFVTACRKAGIAPGICLGPILYVSTQAEFSESRKSSSHYLLKWGVQNLILREFLPRELNMIYIILYLARPC